MFTCQTAPRALARAISLALGVTSLPVMALDYTWVGWYGDWDTASNWNPVGVPQDGDSATIYEGGIVSYNPVSPLYLTSVTVGSASELHVTGSSLYADTLIAGGMEWREGEIHLSGGYLGGSNLLLGGDPGSNGRFIWDGGDLDVNQISVGAGGSGTFIYDTNNGNGGWTLAEHQSVIIGEQAGSTGVFEQRQGIINESSPSQIVIGAAGNGTYRQINANHNAWETVIGSQAGSVGTYEMYGYSNHSSARTVVGDAGTGHYVQRGMYHTTGELIVGRSAGGVGDYQLDGYDLNASHIVLGDQAGSQGTLTWNGGDIDTRHIIVGRGGAGTFVMDTGGTLNITGDDFDSSTRELVIGEQAGSEGVFEQRNGFVNHDQTLIVGQAGHGVYRNTGGGLQADIILLGRYAGSEGIFELASDAAWLNTGATLIGHEGVGQFVHTAGGHGTGTLEIGTWYATGHYAFNGGWLGAQSLRINNGDFTWTGGELDVTDVRIGTNMSVSGQPGTFVQDLTPYDTWSLQPGRMIVVGGDGGHGVYEQRSGNIDATQGQVIIGGGGYGTYRHLDGMHMANETVIGQQPVGGWNYPQGRYELLGDAADHVAQRTVVGDGGGATGQFIHAAGSNYTRELLVGRGGGRGEYLMSGGYLDTDSIVLGESGEGRFIWTGGDIYFNNLTVGGNSAGTFVLDIGAYNELYLQPHQRLVIGEQAGSDGVFEQRSGDVNTWNTHIAVGDGGRGIYLQHDGWNNVEEMVLGRQTGSEGTYMLAGANATHNASRTIIGDEGAGQYLHMAGWHTGYETVVGRMAGGSGEYRLDGGQGWMEHLRLGEGAGSQGTFVWSGGNMDVMNLHIGQGGTGHFIQDTGPGNGLYVQPFQNMVIGEQAGSEGVFEQRSGYVDTWGAHIIVGESGHGTYQQRDGYHGDSDIVIGHLIGGEGVYELSGEFANHYTQVTTVGGAGTGRYILSGEFANHDSQHTIVGDTGAGYYVQTAGIHNTQDLVIGHAAGSSGNYELRGGYLNTGTTSIGATEGAAGVMRVAAYWYNSGTVYVGADMFTMQIPSTGLLELHDGAYISAAAVIVGETGAVQGIGAIGGDVTSTGMLAPGLSAGQLDIIGNYTQLAGGTLSIEIGGNNPGIDHDYLYIFGAANLAGTLDVGLLEGYQFSLGESFDILYASTVFGAFDSLLFPIFNGMTFDITYDLNTVRLTVVSAVPVPAAAWLFGSGVVALMGIVRRRKAA